MNLDFTPEYQAFRAEVRDFLETHKDRAPRMSDRSVRSEKRKAWQKILLEHGYAARIPQLANSATMLEQLATVWYTGNQQFRVSLRYYPAVVVLALFVSA